MTRSKLPSKRWLARKILTWWEARRPCAWDVYAHVNNPTINTQGTEERDLALVAGLIAAEDLKCPVYKSGDPRTEKMLSQGSGVGVDFSRKKKTPRP